MPGLLTLGVDDGSLQVTSQRPFDTGGMGTVTSWRPFDITAPLLNVISNRPFDIQGTWTFTSGRPFDVGTGGLLVTSIRPFDIVSEQDGAAIDDIVYVPPPGPVNAVQRIDIDATGGTFTLTFDGETTTSIAYDATPAAVQSALEGLANIDPGDVIVTAGSYLVEFTGQYAGQPVPTMTVDTTNLTGTGLVATVTNGTAGTRPQLVNEEQQIVVQATGGTYTLTFDGETTGAIAFDADAATVQTALEGLANIDAGDVSVTTAADGSLVVEFTGQYAYTNVPTITTSPTNLTGPAPAAVATVLTPGTPPGAATTLNGIQVYDKAGNRLGAITTYSITQPPSRGVAFRGSFGFNCPRSLVDPQTGSLYPNPDLALIPDGKVVLGDRLIVYGESTNPDDPWGGVVTNAEYTDGALVVQCADVFDLLAEADMPDDDELLATQAMVIPSGTPAAQLIPIIIGHANTWYGRNDEVLWGVDASGSETFFGYETVAGDVMSALETVRARSFGEYAWRISVSATSMQPVLVWRDSFAGGTGPALVDGDEGNVVAGVAMAHDPTTVVNGIRLVGSVTKVESKLPAGATALPYREIIPVAEVWADDYGYRRRVNNESPGFLWEVEVPFTINEDPIAADEEAKRRQQFMDFIHGFHAQYGRPWHDGWSWNAGSGSDDEAELYELAIDNERYLTADNYVHFRALGLLGWSGQNRPVAIVMKRRGYLGVKDTYKQYTVKTGDTLYSISRTLYGTGQMWDELYEINRGRIRNANIANDINPYGDRKYTLQPGTVLDYGTSGGGTQFFGSNVVVGYDRINAIQYVFSRRRARTVPTETVFDFEWRKYNMGEYDPQTHGIGVDSPYKTVKGLNIKTRSWRVVPANSGGSGSTSLIYGIDASTTKIPVASVYPLPTTFPYVVTVGTDEKMLVTSAFLNVLTVVRGYEGTPASIHEAGEPVDYIVEEDDAAEEDQVEETTPPPEQIEWPEGVAYATRLLAQLNPPKRKFTVHLANVGGDWAGVELGSLHSVNIQSEGPASGLTGTVRVIGFAPFPSKGSMELIVEDV